jgi:hypothetical protein
MPVKGTVFGSRFEYRIETMSVGQVGYINVEEITVTEKAIFVSIFTEVFEDCDETTNLKITRLGAGLSEKDFELDFSTTDPEDYEVFVEVDAIYIDLIKNKDINLVFETFDLEVSNREIKTELSDDLLLEKKKKELNKATEAQDFILAAKLRDEIKELEKKTSGK